MTALNDTLTLWTTHLLSLSLAADSDGPEDVGPDCCWFICDLCCWVKC
jgi:hypothetical protein